MLLTPVKDSSLVDYLHWQSFSQKYSGLYYKPVTIVNDDSRVINKLEASLTDNARVIIYDRHMFIVQATDENGRESELHVTTNEALSSSK